MSLFPKENPRTVRFRVTDCIHYYHSVFCHSRTVYVEVTEAEAFRISDYIYATGGNGHIVHFKGGEWIVNPNKTVQIVGNQRG